MTKGEIKALKQQQEIDSMKMRKGEMTSYFEFKHTQWRCTCSKASSGGCFANCDRIYWDR